MAGVVGDRYELLEVLGQGGDTEVVRAIDRRHDRLVALKVRRLAADEAREPLLAEGRTLLELRPHHALPVVRDDFFFDDRHVLVVDWVDGTHVERIVREIVLARDSAPWPPFSASCLRSPTPSIIFTSTGRG